MTDPVGRRIPGLDDWGYDDGFRHRFEQTAAPGEVPGRVLRAERRACLVALDGGERTCTTHPRLYAAAADQPTTGDFVAVELAPTGGGGPMVTRVLERRTTVVRASPDPGRGTQALAANVDTVLVAEPLGERWRPRRLERLLVVAWQSGALPVVVLTKADRCGDLAEAIEAAAGLAPGVSVHAVSAIDDDGLEPLEAELAPGTTSVIIGRSGAGKSTLANALSDGAAGLATQAVRDDGKGRHTTVHRELVSLRNGSLLIDTPGIRAIGLADSSEAIGDAFSEVEELAQSCRFGDCAHDTEPGCAVLQAIEDGTIDAGRLDSYRRLLREQERYEAKFDPALRAKRSADFRRFAKMVRQIPKH